MKLCLLVLLLLLPAEAQERKKVKVVFSPTIVGYNPTFEERKHWYGFFSSTQLTERLRITIQSRSFVGSVFHGQFFLKPKSKKGSSKELVPSFYGVVETRPGQGSVTAFGMEVTH